DGEVEPADPPDVPDAAVHERPDAAAFAHPDRDQLAEEADTLALAAPDRHLARRQPCARLHLRGVAAAELVRRHLARDRERPAGKPSCARRERPERRREPLVGQLELVEDVGDVRRVDGQVPLPDVLPSRRVHHTDAIAPPSTRISEPVMYAACVPARKATAAAYSAGSP